MIDASTSFKVHEMKIWPYQTTTINNPLTSAPLHSRGESPRRGFHAVEGLALLLKSFKPVSTLFALCLAISVTSSPAASQQGDPSRQAYCLNLESKLARLMQGSGVANIDRGKLRTNIRNVERIYHRLNSEAERRNCYSYFLFSKELRRTPRCIRIDRKIRDAKNQLARLNDELHRSANSRQYDDERKNELISALARNRCGVQYEREARRRNSFENWFGDGFFGGTQRNRDYGIEDQFKFATHRTLCVRLCDGYYFPLSFATTTNRFLQDASVCQSRCAAPAELYTHPNPGGDAEQMISIQGEPYEKLKNAFRFRKEFVKGCSCKAAEYDPALIAANEANKDEPKDAVTGDEKKPADSRKDAEAGSNTKKSKLDPADAARQLASEKTSKISTKAD